MTYTLPHPLDRKGQLEAFDYILNSPNQFIFIQAPTGSGKSAWVAEASKTLRTLCLVHTKSLQASNYRDSYKFDILYGKANYPCEDKHNSWLGFNADDCDIEGCSCPYQEQKAICLNSQRVSLNYAKYLLSRQLVDQYNPEILFLDECHQLDNIVTDYVGCTIRYENEFVGWNPNIVDIVEPLEARRILLDIRESVTRNEPYKTTHVKEHRRWRRLMIKIETTLDLFSGKDWYFESTEEKIICKPLTAKYHFKKLFTRAPKVVMMSATLKPDLLASRLGIEEYDSYTVSNAFPSPMRRIWDLDAPKMKYGSTEEDKDKQAKVIADSIKSKPDHWTGVIHVTSKFQAKDLAYRLNGISCFIPPTDKGTEVQLQAWNNNRGRYKLCIAWSFHEGVDLGEDEICIVAKTPYAAIGKGYDRARMDYDSDYYRLQTAWKLEQACGRVRRGRLEHYMPNNKFVAIADRSWRGLRHLTSLDFREAVKNGI